MQTFPINVVCEWLGNSRLIAQEHYLRVTEADFDKATRGGQDDAQDDARSAQNGTKCDQNPRALMDSKRQESSGNTVNPEDSCGITDGRYWTRTSDLHDVNVAL
jgi:hypothetical protein